MKKLTIQQSYNLWMDFAIGGGVVALSVIFGFLVREFFIDLFIILQ